MVDKIGINFTAMSQTPPPQLNFTNMTAPEFLDNIPIQANELTGGYFGIFVLLTLAIFLFWLFTDTSQFGFFRYSVIRGLGASIGISLIFGMNMIQVGFITNFVHLAIFMGLYILLALYIIISNPN